VGKIKTAPLIYENFLWKNGANAVIGIDEVGRGPLAGPVVACVLILPQGVKIEGVNDSKKVSEVRRKKLAEEIKSHAAAYAFGIIDAEEIDRINILQATLKAMTVAALKLNQKLGTNPVALVDGNTAPALDFPVFCLPKGDSVCHLIAAASILAKVKRDTIMEELDSKYPIYGFAKHKGYGTAAHSEAIRKHGLCPLHRRTFCGKFTSSW